MLKRWLGPLAGGPTSRTAPRRHARPALEALEDRYVLSTLTVTSLLDDGSAGTLRAQVAAAAAGDTIDFAPELAGRSITLSQGQVVINKDLTVQGPGADQLTVRGSGARIFNVEGPGTLDVTLSGLTLADGNATGGGAVRNDNENLTIHNAVLSNNRAGGGAGGAVLSEGGSLIVEDSTLQNNSAGPAGGAIHAASGALAVRNSTVSGNAAAGDGGGIATGSAAVTLDGVAVSGNTAGGSGGGVDLGSPGGAVVVANVTLSGNTAGSGGGLAAGGSNADGFTVRDSVVDDNTATAGAGGGLFLHGGGGLMTVERTTVSNNDSPTTGGGIHIEGTGSAGGFTLTDSTLSGNRAARGGGLFVRSSAGAITVLNTTISGNAAGESGGGLDVQSATGRFEVLNSTIAGNSAGTDGGGAHVADGAEVEVLESTIIGDNTAGGAGADVDNDGTIAEANNNLVEGGFGGDAPASGEGNVTGLDPQLGPLADNGGPTLTHAPEPTSPAVNAGSDPEGAGHDQRGDGFDRAFGGQADIGAVELTSAPPPPATAGLADVTTPGGTQYEFTVTFNDGRPAGAASLGDGDVRVRGPNGFSTGATLVSAAADDNGLAQSATFRFTPPGGAWDLGDNGEYVVALEADSVQDGGGNAVPGGDLGAFQARIAQPGRLYAVGGDLNGPPLVHVYDAATGELKFEIAAYVPGFRGGVRTATGDVNNDGVEDIITGVGAGGGPHVKVFDGRSGAEIASFFAYDAGFTGGIFVAAGDVNGDGRADIITGADAGAGPHVRVFSGAGYGELASFLAYHESFRGGVRVAAGDLDGDGRADIITGPGAGALAHVRAFDGETLAEVASFVAYGSVATLREAREALVSGYIGGIFVAAGDLDGDGRAEIVTGASANSHVKAFGADQSERASFLAFGPVFTGGARVATGDVNGDGRADLLVGAGLTGGPHVIGFDGLTRATLTSFFALPGFVNGVFVG